MGSSARAFESPGPVERSTASVVLVEGSFAAEGGFEETVYLVRVNDGWMPLDKLVRRRTLGGITACLSVEDDPNEVAYSRRHHLKPRVYWKRETEVEAPVGTRFIKQTWIPNRERARRQPFSVGVPYDRHETELVLRPDSRLVSVTALAAEAHHRIREGARPPERPMTPTELSRKTAELMVSLGMRRE